MYLLHRVSKYIFVFTCLILLTACARGEAREWLNAPGWSHGLSLEETRIGDPVAMAVDDAGGIICSLSRPLTPNSHLKSSP